jgi:hypothetical protein
MTESRELFNTLTEELGDDAKYAVNGDGTILFKLESRGSFEALDVLYVQRMKKNLLSISVMKDRGFVIVFKKRQVLICPEGASPDIPVSIGVREGNLYRLQGMHVQAFIHDSENLCDGTGGWNTCTTGHCRF